METLNSTGSMSRVQYDDVTLLYSYSTIVGYVKDGKAIITNYYYSNTTNRHLYNFREMYGVNKEDTFELGAFYKRAELDGVKV